MNSEVLIQDARIENEIAIGLAKIVSGEVKEFVEGVPSTHTCLAVADTTEEPVDHRVDNSRAEDMKLGQISNESDVGWRSLVVCQTGRIEVAGTEEFLTAQLGDGLNEDDAVLRRQIPHDELFAEIGEISDEARLLRYDVLVNGDD